MRLIRLLVPVLLVGIAGPAYADDGLHELARAYVAAHASGGSVVPSFARQTGLACSACHYQFLALTPFGRKFKLNGYTMTNQASITEKDSSSGGKLGLSPFSMLSAMVMTSLTHTKDGVPGTQNDVTELPQQLSGFLAGRIAPNLGIFSQFTYSGADGSFGIDNIDIRYANKMMVGGSTEADYGITLNNNPTVQDLWNSTPAWGFPFIAPEVAPSPAAAPKIAGSFAQNVLGLGGYTLVGDLVYAEFSVYRSALQGVGAPTPASGAINGVAPYWRIALQKDFDNQSVMLGTYGMHTSLFPAAVSGPTDRYTDVGIDAQFETKVGTGHLVARGSWVHEQQTLDATFAAGGSTNASNTLKSANLNASYYPKQWLGVTAGYFDITGSADAKLYAPAPVSGSANGEPKSNGFIGELDLNPWENARVGLQYTAYSNFNGGGSNYDGSGRSASGNNTLYAFVWLMF
ncbi:MAG TPA: hypothetical protein VEI47_01765 [Gemmatimonadales bacterium]|jgi:hypothetical protein|nr:hypothetical protein [Gemmatimonadales bacterium]